MMQQLELFTEKQFIADRELIEVIPKDVEARL